MNDTQLHLTNIFGSVIWYKQQMLIQANTIITK